jgi:histidinol-phosphatase (PHP family)
MIRGRIAEPYPSVYMLGLLHERNVPVVITADAHSIDHLGGCYGEAEEALRRAGYSVG